MWTNVIFLLAGIHQHHLYVQSKGGFCFGMTPVGPSPHFHAINRPVPNMGVSALGSSVSQTGQSSQESNDGLVPSTPKSATSAFPHTEKSPSSFKKNKNDESDLDSTYDDAYKKGYSKLVAIMESKKRKVEAEKQKQEELARKEKIKEHEEKGFEKVKVDIESQYGLILTDEEFEEFLKSQEKTEPESAQGETTGISSNCASDNNDISSDHANPVVGASCKQNVNMDTVVDVPPSDNDNLKRSPVAKSGMFIDLLHSPTVRSLLSDKNVIHVLQKIKSNPERFVPSPTSGTSRTMVDDTSVTFDQEVVHSIKHEEIVERTPSPQGMGHRKRIVSHTEM